MGKYRHRSEQARNVTAQRLLLRYAVTSQVWTDLNRPHQGQRPISEARIQSQTNSRGIYGGKNGTGIGPQYFGFPLSVLFHHLSIMDIIPSYLLSASLNHTLQKSALKVTRNICCYPSSNAESPPPRTNCPQFPTYQHLCITSRVSMYVAWVTLRMH
jgi:hypothetical protein